MPEGQCSKEADKVAERVQDFKFYHELPLVSTGCDSYASWHPAFKHLSDTYDTDSIAEATVELLPAKKWRDEHLVITGGEPLLGWQRAYPDLLSHPKMRRLQEITFETNGTQPLTDNFKQYLKDWVQEREANTNIITFSVSAKLSCSGELHEEAIKPEVVCGYEEVGYTYLKFVVATQRDVEEAAETITEYRNAGFEGPVYFMPVGGVESVYSLNNRAVAEMALKLGIRYSDRLQVPLWKNAWNS
jgi:organic radical activating enzyme